MCKIVTRQRPVICNLVCWLVSHWTLKKARLHGDDVFFPRILSMSLSYQSFCVVDGGWNDVDDPGKMVCELWISATFRCRSSVQRACPTAGMLQVYHESWQKHLIKPPKHPVMEQRYFSENKNISPELVLFTLIFVGGHALDFLGTSGSDLANLLFCTYSWFVHVPDMFARPNMYIFV